MRLIGLSGVARSGKDTVGAHLIAQHYHHYAFADPIRKAAAAMFGLPLSVFEGTNPHRDEIIPFWGYSPRQMLQLIGTEGGRNLFRQDIWIRRAEQEYINLQDSIAQLASETFGPLPAGMVITDVRFDNEAEWIRSEGGLVLRVERPGVSAANDHVSEKGVDPDLINAVIPNHGTLDDLYMITDLILRDLIEGA